MSLLDAALGYADSHPQWPIIPVHPERKLPLIKTGRDHAEHCSTDPDVIREWFRRWPDMAIGTPTGLPSGSVVIDVDDHDALAELEHPGVLGPLPRTKVSQTPRGGQHIWLAHTGVERIISDNGANGRLGKLLGGRGGVDVRADGGEVLLPPSLGRTWLADEDGEPLPPIPPLWLAALRKAGDPPRAPARHVPLVDDDRRVRRARAYLEKMPGANGHGGQGGHTQTMKAAVAMLIGFDLDEATARALLDEYNVRCDPPWNERELDHKLASATRSTLPRGFLLGGA
ncbi:MAG: bifunctional DNA primase/polymerase [Kofleriaceae bacterium]